LSNNYSENQNAQNNGKKVSTVKFFIDKHILCIIIIGLIGLGIRLYYLPFELPIIYDGVDYFSYAVVTSQQGHLPNGWGLTNNGWPIFLSIFFSSFNLENFLAFTHLQRYLSIVISVITIIPVYLLCNRFVEKKYALVGAALFTFDPRIITNSILGVTEAPFILLGTLSIFLFLSKNFRVVMISFFVLALFVMVRYEGILVVVPLLILYGVRNRKDRKLFIKIVLLVGIFIITIFPMSHARFEATGQESIIMPVINGGMYYVSTIVIQGVPDYDDPIYGSDSGESKLPLFMSLGLSSLIKYIGWILIPIFVFFVPIGFFIILKKRDFQTITIFLFSIIMLIPAFYAYGRGIEETRYLYIIFPILCIISSFTMKKISFKFKKENLIIVLIIIGIIFSSIIFLDYKKIDYEHEKQAYLIAKDITIIAKGINHYTPDSKWIQIAEISNSWPEIPLPKETNYNQSFEIKKISPNNYSSIEDYIKNSEEKGLTHIVVNGEDGNPKFLNNVFYNEKEYSYLIKKYDSLDHNYDIQIKLYEIDYTKFYNLND